MGTNGFLRLKRYMTKKRSFNKQSKNENEYKESNKAYRELRGEINSLIKENKRLKKQLAKQESLIPDEEFVSMAEDDKSKGIKNPNACQNCESENVFVVDHGNKQVHICKNCKAKWIVQAIQDQKD